MPPSVQEALDLAGDNLARAASLLWHLDENRLKPGTEYGIDIQNEAKGGKGGRSHFACRKLFLHWMDSVWRRKTFAKFQTLLDKHDSRLIPEYTSDEDLAFILAICETPLIQFVHRWLLRNGKLPSRSMSDFTMVLFSLWFTPNTGMKRNSTGFQHVFCGDLKEKVVTGLHNFVRVFLEESRGNLKYMGYVDKDRVDGGNPLPTQPILGIRFALHGCPKRLSTMFFGVSPEFEFGLYTLLCLSKCTTLDINLGRCRARIKVILDKNNNKIRVAFPQLLRAKGCEPPLNSAGPSVPRRLLPSRGVQTRKRHRDSSEEHCAKKRKTSTASSARTVNEVVDLTANIPPSTEAIVNLTITDKISNPCSTDVIDVDTGLTITNSNSDQGSTQAININVTSVITSEVIELD